MGGCLIRDLPTFRRRFSVQQTTEEARRIDQVVEAWQRAVEAKRKPLEEAIPAIPTPVEKLRRMWDEVQKPTQKALEVREMLG